MFYNTIHLKKDDLKLARLNAKSQEDFIKIIFTNNTSLKVTPSQMLILFGSNRTPITSIRRALTNLSNDNFLEKSDETIIGMYGKPEHVWKLKRKNSNTNKFF